MEMPNKPGARIAFVDAPKWCDVNESHAEEWCKENLTAGGAGDEVQRVLDDYNVARVLDGFGIMSTKSFSGILRNLGFSVERLPGFSRRVGVIGYHLKG
jgi:hypothetical protein